MVDPTIKTQLGFVDTLRILLPYVKRHFLNQVSGIWFIVCYLILFQLLVLQLPLVFAGMIAAGIFIVAVGLMFFMEGLRLGLMPLGEVIGSMLPRSNGLPMILLFAFLLGLGATFAEPAIAVLKAAGSGVQATQAPLLYSLLNEYSTQLVACVGIGVGLAVLLGVLRFFYDWPLKMLAIPLVGLLLGISAYFSQVPVLNDVLGLAWDCGAVTTGPVTVPLVLALGIGVCRIVGGSSGAGSGFGIVTLASLFPILAVLFLALFHYGQQDYYGAANYPFESTQSTAKDSLPADQASINRTGDRKLVPISTQEYEEYRRTGRLPDGAKVVFSGGSPLLDEGRIRLRDPEVKIEKIFVPQHDLISERLWDEELSLAQQAKQSALEAVRAIVPLCLFLWVVLRLVVRQRLEQSVDVGIGVLFAVLGMGIFSLGITLGLTPLGGQLGGNIPLSFAAITPWGLDHVQDPLLSTELGKLLAVVFAFFLGYGATLAEPALNALGDTVEKITVGAFRKKLLMQSVAIGVGIGIGAGILKMAFDLPLIGLLIPAYGLVLVLTWFAPHKFVNFAWDSAGVTTGPITVPLVLAMGLGVGANLPGISDGFGILALASVGPILTVLCVGLFTAEPETSSQPAIAEVDDGVKLTPEPVVSES